MIRTFEPTADCDLTAVIHNVDAYYTKEVRLSLTFKARFLSEHMILMISSEQMIFFKFYILGFKFPRSIQILGLHQPRRTTL